MNPLRFLFTGEPGCGKTTLVRRICEALSLQAKKTGGMISGEIRKKGQRIGFKLEDILSGETGILAHVDQADGPRVGKYRVNLQDIERVGVAAIRRAILEADVVVVDEIGPMELNSKPFILAVELALASPKHFIGTIHKRASHYLVSAIKTNPAYQVIEVTPANRDRLLAEISEKFKHEI